MGPKDEPRVWGPLSYPDYLAVREQKDIFSGLVAFTGDGGSISDDQMGRVGNGERAASTAWELVTGNAFDELGVHAALGRTFSPAEVDSPSAEPVAVITDALCGAGSRLTRR